LACAGALAGSFAGTLVAGGELDLAGAGT